MKEWLTDEIVVPVHLAANPLESVAIGTGRSLDVIDKLQKRLNNKIVLLSPAGSYCENWRNIKEEAYA